MNKLKKIYAIQIILSYSQQEQILVETNDT